MPRSVPESIRDLAELFVWRCAQDPQAPAYAFVRDNLEVTDHISYEELASRVTGLAGTLSGRAQPGSRIILMFPPGLGVVSAFWSCILAGFVPVPAPPPDPLRLKNSLPRLRSIIDDAGAELILTDAPGDATDHLSQLTAGGAIQCIAIDQLKRNESSETAIQPSAASIAYLQYTSGSTMAPRGVVLSHGNVLAQCRSLTSVAGITSDSRSLCWLPYFHDYGLVHGIIGPFYAGIPAYLMSSLTFLRRPLRWLEALDRWAITHSGAPNFAYDSCVQALHKQAQWKGNLTRWSVASCGAEPIQRRTVDRFCDAFGTHGFRRSSFRPAYGLAEATLVVSSDSAGEKTSYLTVAAESLESNRVVESDVQAVGTRTLVGCGRPLPDHGVKIVNPASLQECLPDEVGEVWVTGPSVAQGYWNRPEITKETFSAPGGDGTDATYLRTGDLGFLRQGELFITGRLKDLIILNGRNLYPNDLEQAVEGGAAGFRSGGCAAFSVEHSEGERLIVVQEVDRPKEFITDAAATAVRTLLAEQFEVPVWDVVFVRSGAVPRTSSGKVQRQACRKAYLHQALPVIASFPSGGEVADGGSPAVQAVAEIKNDVERYFVSLVAEHTGLPVARINPDAPLVNYALDSLKLSLIRNRIQEDFGTDLNFAQLFGQSTIRDLAVAVDGAALSVARLQEAGTGGGKMDAAAPVSFPLSPSQARIWFLEQMQPVGGLNHISLAIQLSGPFDNTRFATGLEAITRRHEMLRTAFSLQGGEVIQTVAAEVRIPMRHGVLEQGLPSARQEDIRRWIREEGMVPFDLSSAPLMRVLLLEESPDRHIVVITVHRLVGDGWSLRMLARELSTAYNTGGPDRSFPGSANGRYDRYVAWQREWAAEKGKAQRAYWAEQLAHPPAPVQLPTDRPRPRVRQFLGGARTRRLPETLSRSLESLCRQQGSTKFMAVYACFAAWLQRCARTDDVIVGSVVNNRRLRQWESTFGYFVNPVALRLNLSDTDTTETLVAKARRVVAEAYDHQDVPFEQILESLHPRTDAGTAALFNVMIVWEDDPMLDLSLRGLEASHLPIEDTPAEFDLTLLVVNGPEGLDLVMLYNRALFDGATADRMLGQLQRLLTEMSQHPAVPLADLPMASEEEETQVLVDWNQTSADLPFTAAIPEVVETRALQVPDGKAVICGEFCLTYRQLLAQATALARRIHRITGGRNVPVGLCVDRSARSLVGLLGIMKAGAAYVPLDPHAPEQRQRLILRDADIGLVVTQRHLRSRLNHDVDRILELETVEGSTGSEEGGTFQPEIPLDSTAYIIYTSGSTGQPKGVAVSHRALRNSLAARLHQYPEPAERSLLVFPLVFDGSITSIFWSLLHCGTLVVPSGDAFRDPQQLGELIARHRITHAVMIPSLYDLILHQVSPAQLESLRVVVTAGEPLPLDVVHRHYEHLQDTELYNEYGPTEATVWATVYRTNGTEQGIRVPIGKPIANTTMYVLDPHMRPVPIGVIGELYIGGASLADGYYKQPTMTDAKFVENPFHPGTRLYRSGDLGLLRPDGNIEFLGREDEQVKIRGYRIEPGEITTVLRAIPDVQDAAVVVQQDPVKGPSLIAFVAADPATAPTAPELLEILAGSLPSYMVPQAVVILKTFPHLPNGKLDQHALRRLSTAAGQSAVMAASPRDPIEQSLLELWAEVLGKPPSDIHQSFFALGGHSLLATQVVSRVREVFRVELPLRALFDAPTIAGVAEQIRQEQRRTNPRSTLPPIVPVSRTQPLPVSYSQQRMWFIQQLAPEATAYNLLFVSRQKGALKIPMLRRVVDLLSRRHEAFRTTFVMTGNGLMQRIAPWQSPHLAEIDLRRLPVDQREEEARRLAEEEGARPFDLEHGPLARIFVVKLKADDHIIILNLHHIVGDQWSFGILGRDFANYYNALSQNLPVPDVPLPVQYADYAAWQRRSLTDELLQAQERYWTDKLADLPILYLPTDYPRPAMQTFRGAYCSVEIPQPVIESLKSFSSQHGVTSYMTMLACFQLLLSRYSGQLDVAVGSPIANRTQMAMEQLIGTFVNTLVLRLDISGNPTFSDLVQRAKETALGAFANQDYPFDRLVDKLQVARDPSMPPLVQVLFNMVNAPIGDIQLYGLKWEPFEVDPGSAQFDLSLTIELEVSKKAYLTFNTDLFSRATAERMLGHFVNLLDHALANQTARLSEIPMLDEMERFRMLEEWNRTGSDYPHTQCFHELFESQAQQTPDVVAVSMEGEALTYRELNVQANQVARLLHRYGTDHQTVIGLCLERSVGMVAALLGILKAGGTYVPLDPDYPRDRVRFMVEDSGAPVVLTSSDLAERFGGLSCQALCLDRLDEELRQEDEHDLPPASAPADLAYILYTSGSTGQPKGVQISHRSLVNFLWSMKREPGCAAGDIVLSVTTLSFDIAGLELYLPLMSGARVEIVGRAVAMDGRRLIERLEAVRPTMMQATPATWRLLLEAGWTGSESLAALCGGEALPPDLAKQLRARTKVLWNMYGPTETTIWSTVERIDPDQDEITIGRPIANTEIYVLDPQLQPVPVGVAGELFIGGHGLARGYHRRPDLTADRFINHPFSRDPAARLYRTGDLARYRADGRLVHMGRMDHQVKIRGFRIELGEIESILARHPKIKQVVVTAREDQHGLKQLVAYLVPAEESKPGTEELRSYLRSVLPDYMVPAFFVSLDEFPLTANKKINVKALPPPFDLGRQQSAPSSAPRNAMEVQLMALWQQVLGIQNIGVEDNFFDLGGHSLKAAQLFFQLEAVFGKQLPLATLFQAPTIAQLAVILNEADWTPPWQSLVAIQPSGTAAALFLVPGVGGNVLVFAKFAKLLGPEQPVYGLQARGLDGKETPFTSVPEMAAHYVQQIRAVQAEGPYTIAGICTGGLIAYEMAQRLAEQGAAATVFMLDTWHPDSYAGYRNPVFGRMLMMWVLLGKVWKDLRTLIRRPVSEWRESLSRKTQVLASLLSQSVTDHIQDQDFQVQRLTHATFLAVARYRVRRFAGRIVNVVASNRRIDDMIPDTRHRWSHLGGQDSRTIHIPAEDSGRLFVSPYVEELVGHLQHYLRPATAPAQDSDKHRMDERQAS